MPQPDPQLAPESAADALSSELGDSCEQSPAPLPWLRALGLGLGAPMLCAAPRNEEAAAALVTWAGRSGRAFCMAGGATKLRVGAVPSRCDFLLSTKYLGGVFDFDEGNATIEAGAGITMRDLDARVRQARQSVPLESHIGATLGGVASSNSSGARALAWGTPRDLVLGARAILSDGREVRGGGKVVKNVSGYDLPKLFVGARGSLGLLTRITLRLRPLPERSARASWSCASLQEAARLWRLLEGREFRWSGLRADFWDASWALSAWCEGSGQAVARQLERAPQCNFLGEEDVLESEEIWPHAIQISARVPRAAASTWAEAAIGSGARRLSWDCANGALRAGWSEAEVEWPQIAALRAQAEGAGGWLVVEDAPPEWKTPDRVWGDRRGGWFLAQRLKAAYDAANVCAPGRGVGGL